MERKILAAVLTDRANWNKIQGHLKQEELSAEGSIIYDLIQEYYALDNGAGRVDCDLLEPRIARRVTSNKHVEVITNYLKQCASEDVSGVNVVQEVLDHKAHAIGLRLAAKLASGKQSDDVNQLMEDWQHVKSATSLGQFEVSDEEFSSVRPSTLLKSHFAKEGLIEVWPKPLNDMIDGGAKPGHHILVFAPTEMGKTLMVINMVAGFLRHGHRVCGVQRVVGAQPAHQGTESHRKSLFGFFSQ